MTYDALLHELEHDLSQSGIGHTNALERPSQSGALRWNAADGGDERSHPARKLFWK